MSVENSPIEEKETQNIVEGTSATETPASAVQTPDADTPELAETPATVEVAEPVEEPTAAEAPVTTEVSLAAETTEPAEEPATTKALVTTEVTGLVEALKQEAVKTEATASASTHEEAPAEALGPQWASKADVMDRLRTLKDDAENALKNELDTLKQAFYKFYKAEQEGARKLFIETNGEETAYTPVPSSDESEFKTLMAAIKEKRSSMVVRLEQEKEENLKKKLTIIEKIKTMVESSEDVNKAYNEFKKLQQEWDEIRLIPQGKINELWKNYQFYVEQFYDLIKINNEFREYDFKKNLEIKTKLCEAAEKLAEETDVVSAFHQLQKLHQLFRETGPVAKDLREDLWNRFKAASTEVNRRHQKHFEELKAGEQNNLDQKTVICEIVEAIEYDALKTFSNWDHKTQEVIALQAKWKTIGFAPQKMNQKIFERFRAACDEFFRRKGEFFKSLKEQMNLNLEKKKALCEQAEALKESTEWRETSEALTKLQKEWKEIGPVQKKFSDAVWKSFISACDYFFEQKNKATSSQRSAELENLEKKKTILTQLEELDTTLEGDEAIARIKGMVKEYNEIGHVPFKEKDKIYKKFKELVDQEFDRLHVSSVNRKLSNFRNSIHQNSRGGGYNRESQFSRERRDLMRMFDNLKNEIQTYENNLGFLSSASKKGNSLVTELNRKVEKLKSDLALIVEKIKVLDEAEDQKTEGKQD